MKTVVMFSCDSKDNATLKAEDLKDAGFKLVVFEPDVTTATCDFSAHGGGTCATGGVWIVAGAKSD
jgi:hypothetical protein